MTRLVAIDPGRSKCGLVLVDPKASAVLDGKVIAAAAVIDLINSWQKQAPLQRMMIGNGTSSEYWQKLLSHIAPLQVVEERGTTLRARQRYWQLWPPNNWQRWLPRGMILPPHDLDAVAALVLLEDHLQQQLYWPGPPNFRTEP
jgi:RNase H-fold protein (predicted Holliday junction resolvase)